MKPLHIEPGRRRAAADDATQCTMGRAGNEVLRGHDTAPPRPTEVGRHAVPEARCVREPTPSNERRQARGGMRHISAEELVGALAVENHFDAVLRDEMKDAVLGEDAGASERLVLRRDKGCEILYDVGGVRRRT